MDKEEVINRRNSFFGELSKHKNSEILGVLNKGEEKVVAYWIVLNEFAIMLKIQWEYGREKIKWNIFKSGEVS